MITMGCGVSCGVGWLWGERRVGAHALARGCSVGSLGSRDVDGMIVECVSCMVAMVLVCGWEGAGWEVAGMFSCAVGVDCGA